MCVEIVVVVQIRDLNEEPVVCLESCGGVGYRDVDDGSMGDSVRAADLILWY